MTTLKTAKDAVRAMDEAIALWATVPLEVDAMDTFVKTDKICEDAKRIAGAACIAHVRSLPEPGEAVVHGLRRKGTTAIIGIIPNKIAAKPATASKWMDDFEEIPLFDAPVVSEWRTIESAPRDGETIIAGNFGQPCFEMYWHRGADNYWKLAGWYYRDDDVLTSKPSHPDVWHPMLKAPAQPPATQAKEMR